MESYAYAKIPPYHKELFMTLKEKFHVFLKIEIVTGDKLKYKRKRR